MRQFILNKIDKLADTAYVRSAIEEQADLSAFREKPTVRILVGVFAIGLSFLLGWPAVAALGVVSLKLHTPWIVAIGGPLVYGFSHLVFIFGMWLSGAVYTMIFCRWLVRIIMERAMEWAAAHKAGSQT